MSTPDRTEDYDKAVKCLLSPLHQATTPDEIRAAAARRTSTLHDMQIYLHRLGLNVNDGKADNIPRLIFHLTGTKGKGSTLAFCQTILRNGYNLNTGMFTSPHLVCIRERIRINGLPVSKEVFAKVYWAVRRKLECEDFSGGIDSGSNTLGSLPKLPGYFRMLTLMAIYTFCHCKSPKIDAILLEVGMGGRYDSTNVFEPIPGRILMRGVTLIDYDHTRVLGSTLEQIAWEKGGIFCSNKLANIGRNDGGYSAFMRFTQSADVNNHEDKKNQLSTEASSKTTVFASGSNTLKVLDVLRFIIGSDAQNGELKVVDCSCMDAYPELGLKGNHQRSNAGLALEMCQHAMNQYLPSTSLTSEKMHDALAQTFWPGRCHTVSLPSVTNKSTGIEASVNLRCDGAHTPISINACVDWFQTVASDGSAIYNVLIFNCSHERNPLPLLYSLHQSKLFDSVHFCRADFERPSALAKRLEDQWYKQDVVADFNTCHLTLEDMCNAVGATACDASTWQETLANVWKVFSLYEEHLNGNEIDVCQAVGKVSFGLSVKAALLATKEDFSAMHFDKEEVNGKSRVEICVTGSLYIVGSALESAHWEESSIDSKTKN